MILFNELRLNDSKDKIIIDCSVRGIEAYSGINIEAIYVDYYKNSLVYGTPSELAVQLDVVPGKEFIGSVSVEQFQQSGISTFDGGLFYVIVETSGTPSASVASAACGYDENVSVGVVADWEKLYVGAMSIVNSLVSDCSACKDFSGFEQLVVMWHALNAAIDSCDSVRLHKLWDKFLRYTKTSAAVNAAKVCGCNK